MRSYALLLTSPDDGGRIIKRFEQEFPPLEKIKDIYEKVCSYLQIGIGDGAEASFLFNIHSIEVFNNAADTRLVYHKNPPASILYKVIYNT